MSNFDTVKLVRSVVAERGLNAVMTHFHVYQGRLQGSDGNLTLDAPWPDFAPKEPINVPAEPLVRAFEAMADPVLDLKGDHLVIREGKMRVRIPLLAAPYPVSQRPDQWDDLDDGFLQALRKIRGFVSEDASRPWACGVLVRGGRAYATNNVVMAGIDLAAPDLTIPGFAIDQLNRCQLPIEGVRVTDSSVAFALEGDVWLKSARYQEQWPDVEQMFAGVDWDDLPALRGNEKAIVEKLLPFVPDKRHPVIRFSGDAIATMEGDMEAAVECECDNAAFHAVPLLQVLKIATHMKFAAYPSPVPFADVNEGIQGIMAGVRI